MGLASSFLTILTGRNMPKIRQLREPEPSIINEKTIADFTRVVVQTGNFGGDVGRADDVCADRRDAGLEPRSRSGVQSQAEGAALGPAQASEGPMTVFVYVNTAKQVGDADHVKVFANVDAAEKWFEENDPEGVAFEYEVLE